MIHAALPREWARGPQWASAEAQAEWAPRLQAAQTAWEMTEVESVRARLRNSALVFLTPEELVRAAADCAVVGLNLTPLAAVPQGIRAAVHRESRDLATAWRAAWAAADDEAVGDLLGFPTCCRQFFLREWKEGGSSDVTRAMLTVEGPWEANIMLRWMGVRLVPHLPCSGACPFTLAQARAYLSAGAQAGAQVDQLEALLRLPVKYSALSGVGIVETPHFRFMFGTDYCASVETRERAAQLAPSCGKWPGTDPGVHYDGPPAEPASSEDNGFSTHGAMERAHSVVARVAGRVRSAVDLGCGDATLLRRLHSERELDGADDGVGPWVGVESDAGRAARGAARHPEVSVVSGRIQDLDAWTGWFDVALLMPGRLLEMVPEQADAVRAALRHRAGRLVVYVYGDVLHKYGGLERLSRAAGLSVVGDVQRGDGVEAAEASL